MPFWGTLHITMHTWASRYQRTGLTCLAAQLPRRAGPPRLHTILVLLSFLTFVATSSPHRVHHLGEAHPPQRLIHHHVSHGHDPHHDHPAPADQPASQPHSGNLRRCLSVWCYFCYKVCPSWGPNGRLCQRLLRLKHWKSQRRGVVHLMYTPTRYNLVPPCDQHVVKRDANNI